MRRTTQWAFFTSMNQQPAWRTMVEPADSADAASAANEQAAESEPLAQSAREPRRDRVEFM